jgi:hypothetical protein
MVFEITVSRTLRARRWCGRTPNQPFQPPVHRLQPAVSVAFARHDFARAHRSGAWGEPKSGVLIANPNAGTPGEGQRAAGYTVARTRASRGQPRPRAFGESSRWPRCPTGESSSTSTRGRTCRRPQDPARAASTRTAGRAPVPVSDLAVEQQPPAPGDLDPYHAPAAVADSTTNESFFPVAAPHVRWRRSATSHGKHPSRRRRGQNARHRASWRGQRATRLHPTALGAGITRARHNNVRFTFRCRRTSIGLTVQYERAPRLKGVAATLRRPTAISRSSCGNRKRFCSQGVGTGRSPAIARTDHHRARVGQASQLLERIDAAWSTTSR